MKYFQPNLESKRRRDRALCGILIHAAAALAWQFSMQACDILLASAGFVYFEAARGWCVLRACGIRTKL
jgi:hypothetical protein